MKLIELFPKLTRWTPLMQPRLDKLNLSADEWLQNLIDGKYPNVTLKIPLEISNRGLLVTARYLEEIGDTYVSQYIAQSTSENVV